MPNPNPATRRVKLPPWAAWIAAGTLIAGVGVWWTFGRSGGGGEPQAEAAGGAPADPAAKRAAVNPSVVRLPADQQRAIELKTVRASLGQAYDTLKAPGRVAPDETQYAYITPRAAGVVRTVTARVGQDVRAGDLLATIESPVVGEARLQLYTESQALEIATTQADWQEQLHRNTLDLIDHLEKGESPDEIHRRFEGRPVGSNRERLLTAYAQYRLAKATINRSRELHAQGLITPKQYQQVLADYEAAQATYQSLLDEMGFETRLAYTRAQQAKRQAETAVRVTQERLRILGVKPDGTEPEIAGGRVVGVKPDGTLPAGQAAKPEQLKPEAILPPGGKRDDDLAVEPLGSHPAEKPAAKQNAPVSSFSIWAPFDGTILDREYIVPGVAVDTSHRIFTMANLASVWVEANVHESDFSMLARSRGGRVQFTSPAYPDQVFEGTVIYTGDLVDEKSRTIKLLARAENPDRLLKPGMFVEVTVLSPEATPAVQVPMSALLTEGERTFVYVRTAPDRFERREVVVGGHGGGRASIRRGLEPGEEVVVEGAYKLKAEAVRLAKT